jgi:cysteine desulfurase / selenocysteine lyase
MKLRLGKDLRGQFPQLLRTVRGQPLVYLDSAATTLKPTPVIEAVNWYYSSEVANIHRGAHFLGDQGTAQFEAVRDKIRGFINAKSTDEIVFTKGTTEGLNLLAHGLVQSLRAGDEILLTEMEHHSNIVPWQLAAEGKGVKIRAVKVTEHGELDLEDFRRHLSGPVKILSLVHLSNSLGTINPVAEMVKEAKAKGITTAVDAAQSVGLGLVDVQKLDCDFLVFSGHKIYGPTGVGVVYGRKELLNALPPYQGGGSMISQVTFAQTTYLDSPHRFEAGTQPIAEVIGLGAAIDFLTTLDHKRIRETEKALSSRAITELEAMGGVQVLGGKANRANIVSFLMEGAHASDIGNILDQQGVAVRTGHHCCQPLMAALNITGTVRISLAAYSDQADVDAFLKAMTKVKEVLQ